MNRKLLCNILLMLSVCFGFSQNLWKKVDKSGLEKAPKVHRSTNPEKFLVYQLNIESLKSRLVNTPLRGEVLAKSSPIKIDFPNANGEMERFAVIETPIMEEALAEKFPMIKSYAAQGIDDPSAIMRFTVTQFGLHTMTLSGSKGSWFIDPYTEDRQNYMIYTKEALGERKNDFSCLTDESEIDLPSLRGDYSSPMRATDDGLLRTYRLAQSCTGEYGAIFAGSGTIAEQKANVQAQMAITMTRVNGIYEKDLAVTMIFVANNDLVIYLDGSTDPWTNEWNTKTAQTLDSEIGVANYDIGHNFNTTGGGNAGCLGCVCLSVSQTGTHKGRGYTGRADPTGDPFDVDYVAHEMGHQFNGYHTMNTCSRSGSGATEVEPASGSTIMAYAGICSSNVQNNSDDYFNYVNVRDISANIQPGGNSNSCAAESNTGNAAPTADAGQDWLIPADTPYMLIGLSTDADGTGSHTFTWEQNDPEQAPNGQAPPASTSTVGPMTRSFKGTTDPIRYIPRLQDLKDSNGGSTTWEVLPTVNRNMEYALTVRDNNAGGGQTADDLMTVSTTTSAGPFRVTSQNAAVTWAQGSTQTITWDVAGTTGNGINTANVDILFYKDGDFTAPTILASAVPNDGSHDITVPNGEAPNCRVVVRGTNHVFFNMNTADILVQGAVFPAISYTAVNSEASEGSDCGFQDVTVGVNIAQAPSQDADVNFSVVGGTATQGMDFDLVTTSLTFLAGTTSTQDLVIRVYHDGFNEGDETLTVDFTVDANGGDAQASSNSFTLTINDDDAGAPTPTNDLILLDANFDANDTMPWSTIDSDGDGNNWLCCYSGVSYPGLTGTFALSESHGTHLGTGQNYKPDNYYHTSNTISIPAAATNVNFSFGVAGFSDAEPYEVYWTTDVSSAGTILAGLSVDSGTTLSDNGELKSIDITSIAGQTGYLVIRHVSTGNGPAGTGGLLLLDNVTITATVPSVIQTAVNEGSTNDQFNLPGSGMVYTSDSSSSDLMLDIVTTDGFDYGCTTSSVFRSGIGAQAYNGSVSPDLAMDKAFRITPTSTTTTGSTSVKFYFTEAEISGWESATGNSRNDLVVYREGVNDLVVPTIGAFGSDVTLTANFKGLVGDYYFGTNATFAKLLVSPRVYLQGAALNPNSGEESLMRDDLRVGGMIPTTSPYADAATCDASVFTATGANAIVDWVWVELRDDTNSSTIVHSQSALLQRDGDVVGVDGTSALEFNSSSKDYFVAIKHRNHLGIMSASAISLGTSTTVVDFSMAASQITHGTNAQTTNGMPSGVVGMWAGDVNGDGIAQYTGGTADSPEILTYALNDAGNFLNFPTFTVNGYSNYDIDMNGGAQYTGSSADSPILLQNALAHPGNFLGFSTYSITEQLP